MADTQSDSYCRAALACASVSGPRIFKSVSPLSTGPFPPFLEVLLPSKHRLVACSLINPDFTDVIYALREHCESTLDTGCVATLPIDIMAALMRGEIARFFGQKTDSEVRRLGIGGVGSEGRFC